MGRNMPKEKTVEISLSSSAHDTFTSSKNDSQINDAHSEIEINQYVSA